MTSSLPTKAEMARILPRGLDSHLYDDSRAPPRGTATLAVHLGTCSRSGTWVRLTLRGGALCSI